MRQLREIAGESHWFYQAVDSLLVDELGYQRLKAAGKIQRGSLGKLKVQEIGSNPTIGTIGHYRIGAKDVLVGRKGDFERIDDISYAQTVREPIEDILFDPPREYVRETRRIIRLPSVQFGGQVLDDGTVRRMMLNEPLPDSLREGLTRQNHILSDQVNSAHEIR